MVTMPTPPLEQLLEQRKLFFAFVRHRVSDATLAEDILQTCYLRAFQHQNDFKPDESAVAWFYRLLRNAVIDSYRRSKSLDKALEEWSAELRISAQPYPELHNEVCACINAVVEGLRPEYAEVIRAVDLGEQRVQDFAKQHDISASNAGVRIHRARAAFRKQLMQTCSSCAEHGCLNCTCKRHVLPAI